MNESDKHKKAIKALNTIKQRKIQNVSEINKHFQDLDLTRLSTKELANILNGLTLTGLIVATAIKGIYKT